MAASSWHSWYPSREGRCRRGVPPHAGLPTPLPKFLAAETGGSATHVSSMAVRQNPGPRFWSVSPDHRRRSGRAVQTQDDSGIRECSGTAQRPFKSRSFRLNSGDGLIPRKCPAEWTDPDCLSDAGSGCGYPWCCVGPSSGGHRSLGPFSLGQSALPGEGSGRMGSNRSVGALPSREIDAGCSGAG